MPWHLSTSAPGCSGWAVVQDSNGKVVGCHPTKQKALAQLAALNANVKEQVMDVLERVVDNSAWDGNRAMSQCNTASDYESICAGKRSGDAALRATWALPHHYLGRGPNAQGTRNALSRLPQTQGLTNKAAAQRHLEAHMREINPGTKSQPPKENLFRAVYPGLELRSAGDGAMPVMGGHFAVFNDWTRISSIFEGEFMEQVAPGSFTKTFAENRDSMRVLFQHGRDPQIGDKPLGPIEDLEEDAVGASYGVPLLNTSYNRDLVPGLEAGLYGASFRFRVMREEFVEEPGKSAHNPDGIPERTIKEAQVMEFGPVTFPAYGGATAGVRSITDEILFGTYVLGTEPEKLLGLVQFVRALEQSIEEQPEAPSTPDAGQKATSGPERRIVAPPRKRIDYLAGREPSWKL